MTHRLRLLLLLPHLRWRYYQVQPTIARKKVRMIPFEELCQALERHKNRAQNEAEMQALAGDGVADKLPPPEAAIAETILETSTPDLNPDVSAADIENDEEETRVESGIPASLIVSATSDDTESAADSAIDGVPTDVDDSVEETRVDSTLPLVNEGETLLDAPDPENEQPGQEPTESTHEIDADQFIDDDDLDEKPRGSDN